MRRLLNICFFSPSLADGDTLKDKCIFYTRGLDPLGPVKLSKGATKLACTIQKYTIWHLWSNENDERANYKKYMDHYGLFNTGNHLHVLETQEIKEDLITKLPVRKP